MTPRIKKLPERKKMRLPVLGVANKLFEPRLGARLSVVSFAVYLWPTSFDLNPDWIFPKKRTLKKLSFLNLI